MRVWTEAVKRAIVRHVARTGSPVFTRQAFFAAEEAALRIETQTVGVTPRQTATREFQVLRDSDLLEFLGPGSYRWLGEIPAQFTDAPSSAILVLDANADRKMPPERGFVFSAEWLRVAHRTAEQWIIYQAANGYAAAAQVTAVVEHEPGFGQMQIDTASYLEFGRTVPMRRHGVEFEHSLFDAGSGRFDHRRAAQPIRAIPAEEFNRILAAGLVTEDELLPRDVDGDATASSVREERIAWEGSVDRTKMLVEKTVRNRQFRMRVLEAYEARCAMSGMNIVNGGGRAEAQAAHIKSVAAGGPDKVSNGIALSGTLHWMFDRGLISLSDAGDILLSRAINDVESVERLIYRDRRARFPRNPNERPDVGYLHWHRTECFHH